MICEEAMALMSAKLDGELSSEQEAQLKAHLAACPDCSNLMESLRGLDEKVSALQEPAPAELKQRVLYRINHAAEAAKQPRRRWFSSGALGAVAAILVLLIGLGAIPMKFFGAKNESLKGSPAYETQGWGSTHDGNTSGYQAENGIVHGIPSDSFFNGNGGKLESKGDRSEGVEGTRAPTSDQAENAGFPVEPAVTSTQASEMLCLHPVSQADESVCSAISSSEDAAVLLYTEFDPESLFSLLEREEPKLYALVENLEPTARDGMICYQTNCGTVLAIQEWLLSQLPREEEMDSSLSDAESKLRTRMEALDPDSGSLYRIITLKPRARAILWPETWLEDWADRMREEKNWRLFFPSEDYVPNAEKTAYLVFPGK